MNARRHQGDPTEQAWPIVFIEPDPAQAGEKSRHPLRRGFITALLGIALCTGTWFAGRSSAPTAPANGNTAAATDIPPGRSVQALTPPPQGDLPAAPAAPPVDTERHSPAVARPPVTRSPVARTPAANSLASRSIPDQYVPVPRPSTIAHLTLNSFPWGVVSIDDNPVGNTPMVSLPVLPGFHRIRIEHAGFVAYDRVVRVAPGETFRFTGIVLQQSTP